MLTLLCPGIDRQVNVSDAIKVTLPILSFPDLPAKRWEDRSLRQEIDLSQFTALCLFWEQTTFSPSLCTLSRFTTVAVECTVLSA